MNMSCKGFSNVFCRSVGIIGRTRTLRLSTHIRACLPIFRNVTVVTIQKIVQNATSINNMRDLVNMVVDTSTNSTEPGLQLSKGIFHNSPRSGQSIIKGFPFLVFCGVEGVWLHYLCRQFKSRVARSTTGTSTPPMRFEKLKAALRNPASF